VNTPATQLHIPSPVTGNPGFWTALPVVDRAFVGWNRAQDGSGEWFTADCIIPHGQAAFTVWAQWAHGVVFRSGAAPDGAVLSPNRSRIVEEFNPPWILQNAWGPAPYFPPQTVVGMPPVPIWPGNAFREWRTAGGTPFTDTCPITAPTTLYAQWTAQVVFNPNGGLRQGGVTTSRTAGIYIESPARFLGVEYEGPHPGNTRLHPTRTNWEFAGWNSQQTGAGTTHTATAPAITYGRELWAQWDANVNLNPNGGTWPAGSAGTGTAVSVRPVRYGRTIGQGRPGASAMPTANPTLTNFNPAGWNTVQNPTPGNPGVHFNTLADIAALTMVDATPRTFYAQWVIAERRLTMRLIAPDTIMNGFQLAGGSIGVLNASPTVQSAYGNTALHEDFDNFIIGDPISLIVHYGMISAPPHLNREWYQVDVRFRTYVPGGGFESGTLLTPPAPIVQSQIDDVFGSTPLPSAPPPAHFRVTLPDFEMPDHDLVIYIIFRRRADTLGFNMSTDSLSYGTHPAQIVSSTLTLAQARLTCLAVNGIGGATHQATDPATVSFDFLNTTGEGWTLQVYSTGSGGSDALAEMLVVDGEEIFGAANFAVLYEGNAATQVQTVTWSQLDDRIDVAIDAGSIGMVGATQQAVLNWTMMGNTP